MEKFLCKKISASSSHMWLMPEVKAMPLKYMTSSQYTNYKLVMDLKCFSLSLLGYTQIKNTKHMIICKIGGWIKPNVVPIISLAKTTWFRKYVPNSFVYCTYLVFSLSGCEFILMLLKIFRNQILPLFEIHFICIRYPS